MTHDVKWRRRLVQVAGWTLSLLLVLVGVRVLLLMTDEQLGIHRWDSADYEGSRAAFSRTTQVNPLNPWIGYFNVGTAHYQLGEFSAAVSDFQRALDTAPAQQYCMIALNLSWSWESLGDSQRAGGNRKQAEQSWAQASSVLEGVECSDDSSSQDSSSDSSDDTESQSSDQQQQEDTSQRVQDKIDESQQSQQQREASEQEQQEQLQQRQQEAQSENAQSQGSQGSAPGDNSADRTW